MRFYLLSLLLAIYCTVAAAVNMQRPIIVTYPADTPQSFVDKAMETLRAAGGIITHEYSLIKGFAAKASESTIEAVKALGDEFVPLIENDQVVRVEANAKGPDVWVSVPGAPQT